MTDQFQVDTKAFKELKKFYEEAPKAFRRVSGGVLTRLAMDQSANMKTSLSRQVIVRNPQLIKNSIRYKAPKTIKNKPIDKQETQAFAIKRKRHDGWAGIEDGDTTKMTLFTKAGRGGNRQNKSLPSYRDKKGAHTGPQDFGLPTWMSPKQFVVYLQRISASPSRRRKTWFLPKPGYKKLPPGIYKFIGGSVKKSKHGRKKDRTLYGARIVMVSNPRQRVKLPNLKWNAEALKETSKDGRLAEIWEDNFNHELKKVLIK